MVEIKNKVVVIRLTGSTESRDRMRLASFVFFSHRSFAFIFAFNNSYNHHSSYAWFDPNILKLHKTALA
jgi:hypothetical protein